MSRKRIAGLTDRAFLARHWQKAPLLGRGALRGWSDLMSREAIFELASSEAMESRIVRRTKDSWTLEYGPFSRRALARMPRSGWTLLVQGVDGAFERAARLREEFSSIPLARFDDVMVSYAAPGGGVGPHYDSYDVFLLQGEGRRHWRIGRQRDLTLDPKAPLRILQRFTPDEEWTLEPGDVLYLPPRYAHDGVALEPCITYSIGFRAPDAQELGGKFLEFLQDRLLLHGDYSDPDLRPVRRPARIPHNMMERLTGMLRGVRWGRGDVVEFIGRYLTEPRPHVVYSPPARPLSAPAFEKSVIARGMRLALKTRMLFYRGHVFVNGEAYRPGSRALSTLTALADAGELPPATRLDREALTMLHAWYRTGYLAPVARRRPLARPAA
jgi:50S ribosomal protein L16 3-hydroxylase